MENYTVKELAELLMDSVGTEQTPVPVCVEELLVNSGYDPDEDIDPLTEEEVTELVHNLRKELAQHAWVFLKQDRRLRKQS